MILEDPEVIMQHDKSCHGLRNHMSSIRKSFSCVPVMGSDSADSKYWTCCYWPTKQLLIIIATQVTGWLKHEFIDSTPIMLILTQNNHMNRSWSLL